MNPIRATFLSLLLAVTFVSNVRAQSAVEMLNHWKSCVDFALPDSIGLLADYATVVLDVTPAGGGVIPSGLVIGTGRQERLSWYPRGLDSVSFLVQFPPDSTMQVALTRTTPDSAIGFMRWRGKATDTLTRHRVAARQRPYCIASVPAQVTVLADSNPVAMIRPPAGEPEWLKADSLTQTAPDGTKFVRNVLLVSLADATLSRTRVSIARTIAGIVIGTLPREPSPATRSRSAQFIFWVNDGATLDDLRRVAERLKSRREVEAVTPYIRK